MSIQIRLHIHFCPPAKSMGSGCPFLWPKSISPKKSEASRNTGQLNRQCKSYLRFICHIFQAVSPTLPLAEDEVILEKCAKVTGLAHDGLDMSCPCIQNCHNFCFCQHEKKQNKSIGNQQSLAVCLLTCCKYFTINLIIDISIIYNIKNK